MMDYNEGYGMMNGSAGLFGWLFSLLILAAGVIGIIALVRYLLASNTMSYSGTTRTALDILNERYAKGEITKKEYDDIKKDLAG